MISQYFSIARLCSPDIPSDNWCCPACRPCSASSLNFSSISNLAAVADFNLAHSAAAVTQHKSFQLSLKFRELCDHVEWGPSTRHHSPHSVVDRALWVLWMIYGIAQAPLALRSKNRIPLWIYFPVPPAIVTLGVYGGAGSDCWRPFYLQVPQFRDGLLKLINIQEKIRGYIPLIRFEATVAVSV